MVTDNRNLTAEQIATEEAAGMPLDWKLAKKYQDGSLNEHVSSSTLFPATKQNTGSDIALETAQMMNDAALLDAPTTKDDGLLPCPFDGGSAAIVDYGLEYPDEPIKYQVLCCNGASHASKLGNTAKEARDDWNTRAQPATPQKA